MFEAPRNFVGNLKRISNVDLIDVGSANTYITHIHASIHTHTHTHTHTLNRQQRSWH